jgi:acetate kinase
MAPAVVATVGTASKKKLASKCRKIELFLTDTTVVSPTATTVSQVHAAKDLGQLRIVQFDALLFTRGVGELKRTCLQPLVPNAEAVLIPKQDLDPVSVAAEEQE